MANATRDVRSFDLGAGALPARSISQGDGQGGRTGLWVDDGLGTDFYSSVARSARVVETMERLLKSAQPCQKTTNVHQKPNPPRLNLPIVGHRLQLGQ